MKTLKILALVVLAAAAAAVPANAYTFTFYNRSGKTVSKIYIHTVSSVCRNITWTGAMADSTNQTLSTQPICLGYRFEAWATDGTHFDRTFEVGLTNHSFSINSDSSITVY